jgi:uncharacterized protein
MGMFMSINAKPGNAKCPNCQKPRVHAFRPFCSKGCRDRDLIGWFEESYVLPGRPAAEEGENRDGSAPAPDADLQDS